MSFTILFDLCVVPGLSLIVAKCETFFSVVTLKPWQYCDIQYNMSFSTVRLLCGFQSLIICTGVFIGCSHSFDKIGLALLLCILIFHLVVHISSLILFSLWQWCIPSITAVIKTVSSVTFKSELISYFIFSVHVFLVYCKHCGTANLSH